MHLNVRAVALTASLMWGLMIFLVTWWVILLDGISYEPTCIGMIYRGYSISPAGSLVGLVWGLVDGFIGGLIFAWLYNRIATAPKTAS
jgi:hypothetical protein